MLPRRPSNAAQSKIDSSGAFFMEKKRVVTITESEFIRIKGAVMDRDGQEALNLLKEFIKRIEKQENLGLRSHLG
jgi:hypothetical protein